MTGREIQAAICAALANSFEAGQVVSEWNMRKRATDTFQDATSYAPRLDVAIGPFNLSFQNKERDAERIRTFKHPLIERLKQAVWRENHGGTFSNPNPRCLVAIEVEHRTSSKHILGGMTNASVLGLLGVVVGSSNHIAKVRRIHEYACKLKQVEKARDDMFGNVVCFEETEFLEFLKAGPQRAKERRRAPSPPKRRAKAR
jgi:hypothetical protein